MISFICDGCHSELQIGDPWAGKLVRCPYCSVNTRVPGYPKRSSKATIIARMVCIPLVVLAFCAVFLSIGDGLALPFILGGLIALVFALIFLWAFTNLFTFMVYPREYRIWKAGGGDSFYAIVRTKASKKVLDRYKGMQPATSGKNILVPEPRPAF